MHTIIFSGQVNKKPYGDQFRRVFYNYIIIPLRFVNNNSSRNLQE